MSKTDILQIVLFKNLLNDLDKINFKMIVYPYELKVLILKMSYIVYLDLKTTSNLNLTGCTPLFM